MSIADELEKLRKLHAAGEMTDEEYARAKEAVLDTAGLAPPADDEYIPPLMGAEQRRSFFRAWMLLPLVFLVLVVLFVALVLPEFRKVRDNLQRHRQELERRQQPHRQGKADANSGTDHRPAGGGGILCLLPPPTTRSTACTANSA